MSENNKYPPLYPLRFKPAYKSVIWGGEKIYRYKGEPAPTEKIGETWEISGMPNDSSIVMNGTLEGQELTSLLEIYKSELVGEKVYATFGDHFPLLIKLIDANDDLSIQVHPDDNYAQKHHGKLGKTEMWYLLDCTPSAKIYAGWKKATDPSQLREIVQTDEILDYLELHHPKKGDLFFLPAGKVHSIGAGCFVLEIQEASDLTYRLFDFNRVDKQGNKRELHIDRAADVIDYNVNDTSKEDYDIKTTNQLVTLKHSSYFHTSILRLTRESFSLHLEERDSFTFLFVEVGEILLKTANGDERLRKGESLLLPASIKTVEFQLLSPTAQVIDCYIP